VLGLTVSPRSDESIIYHLHEPTKTGKEKLDSRRLPRVRGLTNGLTDKKDARDRATYAVKAHLICRVKTNIVIGVELTRP